MGRRMDKITKGEQERVKQGLRDSSSLRNLLRKRLRRDCWKKKRETRREEWHRRQERKKSIRRQKKEKKCQVLLNC